MKLIRIEMLVPDDADNDFILERAQELALDIQEELYPDDDSMSDEEAWRVLLDDDSMSDEDVEHDSDLISNSVSVQTIQESV